jgi:pentatricopeptide repeat domain-containing protein 1
MEVYQDMLRTGCERSVITYSALISACEKAGQWQLALNLFGEMLRERCTPNVITYNSLITACAQVSSYRREPTANGKMPAMLCCRAMQQMHM